MIIGSDLKINISLEGLPEGVHLSHKDLTFKCIFYVNPDKTHTVEKDSMTMLDDDNYVAQFNSSLLSASGTVQAVIIANIPDKPEGGTTRKEISTASTGIVLTSSPITLPTA